MIVDLPDEIVDTLVLQSLKDSKENYNIPWGNTLDDELESIELNKAFDLIIVYYGG